jgi:hypothetical protein
MLKVAAVWLAMVAVLLIPRPYVRWAKVGDDHEVVYVLHIGLRWLGYGFMVSLSCTDFKDNIHEAMENYDA